MTLLEEKLLSHVVSNGTKGDLDNIIKTIDTFCWDNNWMMNLGDEKSKYYSDELKNNKCKSVLEFGCYMGYSALVALNAMGDGSTVSTIDPNTTTNTLARKIFEFAGVSERVTILEGTVNDFLLDLSPHSCVFFDHIKNLYLSDLLKLESKDLVISGTVIFADNVVYFNIVDLMDYLKNNENYHHAQLYKTKLEYDNTKEDGVFVAVRK